MYCNSVIFVLASTGKRGVEFDRKLYWPIQDPLYILYTIIDYTHTHSIVSFVTFIWCQNVYIQTGPTPVCLV